ncbi:Crp/Fnr family transcriptional regulator [Clostridium sp. P21]|uniref:Crp/Fnr family transcriptional regulator n=1 Tax=Clostridium muellerianum TaxID=2716538 RepID=A0A7Y0EM62_9CLOT|nr:Crp/Fnr family transcriptional regulator [Clostridium muellerianum]NMM66004.1 Crp/Fnr family transcriptional regulator [Clostridium muellerianum]
MSILKVVEVIEKEKIIYNILKSCPYEILKQWEIFKYKKGKTFLKQGEIYPYFFIIIEGQANIFVMSHNGKRYSQSIYTEGNFIGELEIFNNIPYSCSIEALTDIKLLALKRESFLKWYDMDKNICKYITEQMCTAFYTLSQKSAEDTLYTLKERICNYLLEEYGKSSKANISIDKDTLTAQLAVTKRSLNRTFMELRKEGILEISNSQVFIMNLDKLKNLTKKNI